MYLFIISNETRMVCAFCSIKLYSHSRDQYEILLHAIILVLKKTFTKSKTKNNPPPPKKKKKKKKNCDKQWYRRSKLILEMRVLGGGAIFNVFVYLKVHLKYNRHVLTRKSRQENIHFLRKKWPLSQCQINLIGRIIFMI